MYQTDAEASVLTAIRDMFLGQPDGGALVHRLAIFDAHGDITRIVSQMDVLRYTPTHHTYRHTATATVVVTHISHLSALVLTKALSCRRDNTCRCTLLCGQAVTSAPVTSAPGWWC